MLGRRCEPLVRAPEIERSATVESGGKAVTE